VFRLNSPPHTTNNSFSRFTPLCHKHPASQATFALPVVREKQPGLKAEAARHACE
jgi:hypothetical protein